MKPAAKLRVRNPEAFLCQTAVEKASFGRIKWYMIVRLHWDWEWRTRIGLDKRDLGCLRSGR